MAGAIVGGPGAVGPNIRGQLGDPNYRDWGKSGYGPKAQARVTSTGQIAYKEPEGYEWDMVRQQYVRTPTSAGQRTGQYQKSALEAGPFGGGSLPSLSSALSGLRSAAGFGGGDSMSGGGIAGPWSPSSGGGAGGGGGIGGSSRIPSVAPPDTTAASAAIFGRAKDTAGQIGRSSLDSLRAALGETGQLGGGAEVQGTRDVIENAAGQIGDVNRQQAVQQAGQAADFAKLGYTGAITQRGQDIQAQEAQARLAQEQADIMFKQQMAQSQQQLELLRLALSGMGGAYSY